MQIAAKQLLDGLRESADMVFSMMMTVNPADVVCSKTVCESDDCTSPNSSSEDQFDLEAVVGFQGVPSGAVVLRCCSEGAERITRMLLMIDDDEPISFEDIKDALGECANMVTGTLKTRLLDPNGDFELSTPFIAARVSVGHQHQAGKLVYELKSGAVAIEIWLSEECPE